MKLKIKDSVKGRFTKKLLLTCILIMSVLFIEGCIGEEKANSKTSTDLQTSEPLIKPSDLPKGYYSSKYTTYAISKGESFDIHPNLSYYNIIDSNDAYEGDIPKGKKRVATSLVLENEDIDDITFMVTILESDSESRLKEYISEYETSYKKSIEEDRTRCENNSEIKVTYNSEKYSTSIKTEFDSGIATYEVETNLIGDNSVITIKSIVESNIEYSLAAVIFTSKNYVIIIQTAPSGGTMPKVPLDTMRKEILEVAKTIESELD